MSRRDLEYVGGCRRDLSKFPEDVQEQAAFALLEAQVGGKHPDAEPLKGFHGASVLEIRLPYSTDTYRVIYTIRFPGVVYALHAFKKKSTQGIAIPQRHREMIERRLRAAADLHARRMEK
jgi:phage-related protein